MNIKNKLIIQQKLNSIYKLVDEIVKELNETNGIKICYPLGRSQEEVEDALFEFAESKAAVNKF